MKKLLMSNSQTRMLGQENVKHWGLYRSSCLTSAKRGQRTTGQSIYAKHDACRQTGTTLVSIRCPKCGGNETVKKCATGLCIDLLNKLKEDMLFDYELVQARDNNWGNYINDEV